MTKIVAKPQGETNVRLHLVLEAAGLAKAFGFVGHENRIRALQIIAEVRERQAYKELGLTWEAFCTEYLGRARRSVETDLDELEALGAERLTMLQRLGVSQTARRALMSGMESGDAHVAIDGDTVIVGDRRLPLQDEAAVGEAVRVLVEQYHRRANEAEDARAAAEELRSQAAEAEAEYQRELEELRGRLAEKKHVEKLAELRDLQSEEIFKGFIAVALDLGQMLERMERELPDRGDMLKIYRILAHQTSRVCDFARGFVGGKEPEAGPFTQEQLDEAMRAGDAWLQANPEEGG